jgi:hypothetical protein
MIFVRKKRRKNRKLLNMKKLGTLKSAFTGKYGDNYLVNSKAAFI